MVAKWMKVSRTLMMTATQAYPSSQKDQVADDEMYVCWGRPDQNPVRLAGKVASLIVKLENGQW